MVSLSDYQKKFKESKFRNNYDRYLKLLKNEELEHEVNYLLDEFSDDNYGNEFFLKGEMILGEIAGRVDEPLAGTIETMTEVLKTIKTTSISD